MPSQTEEWIDLAAIDCEFKGIVIIYQENKTVGIIVSDYTNGEVYMMDSIDIESDTLKDGYSSIVECVKDLYKKYPNLTFKTIDFLPLKKNIDD